MTKLKTVEIVINGEGVAQADFSDHNIEIDTAVEKVAKSHVVSLAEELSGLDALRRRSKNVSKSWWPGEPW